jgi:hypothetical protein
LAMPFLGWICFKKRAFECNKLSKEVHVWPCHPSGSLDYNIMNASRRWIRWDRLQCCDMIERKNR